MLTLLASLDTLLLRTCPLPRLVDVLMAGDGDGRVTLGALEWVPLFLPARLAVLLLLECPLDPRITIFEWLPTGWVSNAPCLEVIV